jgi:hypothetical protein
VLLNVLLIWLMKSQLAAKLDIAMQTAARQLSDNRSKSCVTHVPRLSLPSPPRTHPLEPPRFLIDPASNRKYQSYLKIHFLTINALRSTVSITDRYLPHLLHLYILEYHLRHAATQRHRRGGDLIGRNRPLTTRTSYQNILPMPSL